MRNAPLMDALRTARSLNLSSWCIGAGAVRNAVWDYLHGYTVVGPLEDIDLVFFDAHKSVQFDREVQTHLNHAHPALKWDVTNQAHVHTWYERDFGTPVTPFQTLHEGIASWPEYATCVGLTITSDDRIQVLAPFGLADLFDLHIRHNPTRASLSVAQHRVRGKRWLCRWPKLQLIGELCNAA